MIPAESYEKFAEAVLRKLVLEIASSDPASRAQRSMSAAK
jgi:hypothetical protein